MVSSDLEGKICYWILPENIPVDILNHSSGFNVPSCNFNVCGDYWTSISHDKTIKIWEIKNKV